MSSPTKPTPPKDFLGRVYGGQSTYRCWVLDPEQGPIRKWWSRNPEGWFRVDGPLSAEDIQELREIASGTKRRPPETISEWWKLSGKFLWGWIEGGSTPTRFRVPWLECGIILDSGATVEWPNFERFEGKQLVFESAEDAVAMKEFLLRRWLRMKP